MLSKANQSRAPSAHRALASCPSSRRTRVHVCTHTRVTFLGSALTPLCELGPKRVLGERPAPPFPAPIPSVIPHSTPDWLPGWHGFPEDSGRAAPLSLWLQGGGGGGGHQHSQGVWVTTA